MIGGLWKSTGSMALLAAAGLYLGGAGVSPAQAADLGGDCCADLEERVAELEATTARKGNRRVSLTISGQVNTAVMAWDDGDESDIYVVDNAYTRSGFGFDGSARINPNLTAGFNIAVGIAAGARSHTVNQNDDDAADIATIVGSTSETETLILIETANWYLDHKQLGRLTVGRLAMATHNIAVVDLGGAGVIANARIGSLQRGFFLTGNTPNALTKTWSSALGGGEVNAVDFHRANAVMYQTPTVGGFQLGVTWGENDVWDAALRYAGEFGGFRIAAGLGYAVNMGNTDEVSFGNVTESTKLMGSASVLHVASGLFLSASYAEVDRDVATRPTSVLWYVTGGIAKNWTGLGKTVLFGEYAQIDDPFTGLSDEGFGGNNPAHIVLSSEARMWGIGVVQNIDAAAMELYVAYRVFSLDADTAQHAPFDYNDFQVLMAGSRIRF